jgi:hypothetical protein
MAVSVMEATLNHKVRLITLPPGISAHEKVAFIKNKTFENGITFYQSSEFKYNSSSQLSSPLFESWTTKISDSGLKISGDSMFTLYALSVAFDIYLKSYDIEKPLLCVVDGQYFQKISYFLLNPYKHCLALADFISQYPFTYPPSSVDGISSPRDVIRWMFCPEHELLFSHRIPNASAYPRTQHPRAYRPVKGLFV